MCGGARVYFWCVGVGTQMPVCVCGSQRTTVWSRLSLYTLHGFQGSHSSVKTCTASTFTQWSILLTFILALLDTALYVKGVLVLYDPWRPLSNWPLQCYSELGRSVPLKIRCDSSCSHLACSLKMTPQDLITWHLSFAEASKQIAENKNTPRVSIFVCGRHTRQVILEIQKLNSVVRLD